jgi:hypothetical protein
MITLDPQFIDEAPFEKPQADRDGQHRLLARSKFLLPEDRRLVELFVRDRLSHRQIARARSEPSWKIQRRLQRLGQRLNDPLVIALLDERCELPQEYRQLVIEQVLQFRTLRQLAGQHRMGLTKVSEILTYVRGWHRGMTQQNAFRANRA